MELFNDENKSIFDGFHETHKSLIDYGHNLILIYPIPEFGENIPNYYKKGFGKVDLKDLNIITKDKRFYVEFEYNDRSYAQSTIFSNQEIKTEKVLFNFNFYSESDWKNQNY